MPLNEPVPSPAADVLEYNAERFDEVLTSDNDTYTDRLGRVRKTVRALEAAVEQAESGIVAGAWIYTTVAAGEAVRTDGDYFWVVSADDSEVLELWLMGASTATDTSKRTISSNKVAMMGSDAISGLSQTTIKPNLLPPEVYSCSELPTIPAATMNSWPATIALFNAKPVLKFDCDNASVLRCSFQSDLEPVDTFADGVSSFSIVIEKSDVRVSAPNSKIYFVGYSSAGVRNGLRVIVPFLDAGFSTSVVSSPRVIRVDNVDISSVIAGSAFVKVTVELGVLGNNPTLEVGDSLIVHSPCWVADNNSNFRINVMDGLLSLEGETW